MRPADELFDRDVRAFSHGCIRVERPRDLVRGLMQPPGGPDSADLETLLARGERARVDLQESVPVYVAYFTTWVDEDATVTFHPDVYERDEPIQAVQERR